MNQLNQHIEALVFCSESSISLDEITASLKLTFDWEPADAAILRAIEEIQAKYESEEFSFQLVEISNGYQFMTKKEYHATINALIQHKSKKKLSVPQMETLSIIAYKQPMTKSEIEHIRGVNCDYAIQKLLEKDLVTISGKSDGPGRPILYSTSQSFMDYFGIRSVKDLPQLKDIHIDTNEIGTSSEYSDQDVFTEEAVPVADAVILTGEELNAEGLAEVATTSETIVETDTEVSMEEVSSEETGSDQRGIAVEESDEMPPVMGEEEDLVIPDRKTIFMENQVNTSETDEEISEENNEIRGEADPL